MTRKIVTILLTSAALAAIGTAQERPTPARPDTVTVTGCVDRAQRDGSLGGTVVGTTSTPGSAPRDANSGETLDLFLLNDASASESTTVPRTTFGLEGHEKELANLVGQRVEITGITLPPSSSSANDKLFAAGARRLRVSAMRPTGRPCKQP